MSGRYAAPPPRSKKHTAHLQKVKRMRMFIPPSDAGLPTEPWWALPQTREEFYARLAQEASRMALSRFGRTQLQTPETT